MSSSGSREGSSQHSCTRSSLTPYRGSPISMRTLVLMSASVKSCQADSAHLWCQARLCFSTRSVLCSHRLDLGLYGHEATLGGWRTDLFWVFWPCVHWWRSFSVQFRRQHRTVPTQLFTDSCHPWSKDLVGQDKVAEPGFRSQSNQSADWWQWCWIRWQFCPPWQFTKIWRQQSSRHEAQD